MSAACPWFIAALDPGLCRAVDHYCERTGPAFDAEPVNALTNLAFLVAGYAALRLHAARLGRDLLIAAIVLTIPVVGLATSDRFKKHLALKALRRAVLQRQPIRSLIHHLDRGSQNCSIDH